MAHVIRRGRTPAVSDIQMLNELYPGAWNALHLQRLLVQWHRRMGHR